MRSSTFIFDWTIFILAGNEDSYKILDGFKFGKIEPGSTVLAALEGLEKFPYIYNCRKVVTTLTPSFLNGSSRRFQGKQ